MVVAIMRFPSEPPAVVLPELALFITLNLIAARAIAKRRNKQDIQDISLLSDVLISRSPLGVAVWNEEGRLVSLNHMVAKLCPLPKGEQLGKYVTELYPQGGERIHALMKQVFTSGEPILREEFVGKAPSNLSETRCWTVSFYPINDAGGVRLVATLVEDTTALQLQKRELERAKMRLEDIIEVMEEGFIVIDNRGTIEYANSKAIELLSSGDIIGQELGSLLQGKAWYDVLQATQEVLRQGCETKLCSIPQEGRKLQFSIARCSRGVTLLARDITEQQLYEDTLRKSSEQLSVALDAADAGYWSWDVQSDSIELSRRSAEQLGIEEAIITLQEFLDHVLERDRLNVKEEIDRVLQQNDHFDTEFRIELKNEELRWIRLVGRSTLSAQGRPLSVIGVQFDISQRKKAEDERAHLFAAEQVARAEAERANRMKDDFIAVISHELRTPLNAILGWSQLLKRGLPKSMELSEAMTIIEQNAKAQATLIEDLLDVSRIVSGKVKISPQKLNVQELVDSCVETVSPSAEAKRLTLTLKKLPEEQNISGDPGRLRQVILNLLTNAIKFTPEGGMIIVSVGKRYKGMVDITVKDTGIGMDPSFLPYAFDKYKQGAEVGGRSSTGLGLGLAIVKQLVELHRGSIEARSEGKGRGSEFIVSLPTADEQNKVELQLISSGGNLSGVKVLIVDDDKEVMKLTEEILRDEGAEVVGAETIEEALKEMASNHPAVIVSKLSLETNEGFRLIDSVRKEVDPEVREIPAIALSLNGGDAEKRSAISAGFQSYLTKPVRPQELVSAVREAAHRRPIKGD